MSFSQFSAKSVKSAAVALKLGSVVVTSKKSWAAFVRPFVSAVLVPLGSAVAIDTPQRELAYFAAAG